MARVPVVCPGDARGKRGPRARRGVHAITNAGDLGRTFPPGADLFAPETGSTYAFDLSIGFKKITVTAIKQGGQWVIDVFTVGPR